jgi:hypothetical protein
MMIQHGGNYYIAHPKTATHSTIEALKAAGWTQVADHHGIYPYPAGSKVISVVRDPMDWLVSWYHYLGGKKKYKGFPEFLRVFGNPLQIGGMHFYGVYCSTHVIFFDNMKAGWDAVLDDIRRPRITLGRQNVSLGRGNVSDYYDNETFALFMSRWGDLYSWYQTIHSMKGDAPFLRRSI